MIPAKEAIYEWLRREGVINGVKVNTFNDLKLDHDACFNLFSLISR